MKLIHSLLVISICLLFNSGLEGQWNTIEELENTGFRIDRTVSISDSDGVGAIRWRMAIAQTEMEMLRQQIAELKSKQDETELQQRAIREKLARLGVFGSTEDRLKEINADLTSLQSELAAAVVQQETLKERLEFERPAREEEQDLAAKQRQILQQMFELKSEDLMQARRLAEKGTISAADLRKSNLEFKELELRFITEMDVTSRKSQAVGDIQASLVEAESRMNILKTRVLAQRVQREEILNSQVLLVDERRLQFDQQLALEMIMKTSLRIHELELESIRLNALLTMVERKSNGDDKEQPVEAEDD